jgi:Notch-like protein
MHVTDTGFTGTLCDTDEDDCLSNPCQSGGTCTDNGFKAYSCDCMVGWKGLQDCTQNYDSCIDGNMEVRCQNYGLTGGDTGATCVDWPAPEHGFSCVCTDEVAWEVDDNICVDVDMCSAANGAREVCRANGDIAAPCTDRVAPLDGYACGCTVADSWEETGPTNYGTCTDVDDCIGNPCDNAGDTAAICVDDAPPSASHTCVCSTSGWYDNAGVCSNVDECAAGGIP